MKLIFFLLAVSFAVTVKAGTKACVGMEINGRTQILNLHENECNEKNLINLHKLSQYKTIVDATWTDPSSVVTSAGNLKPLSVPSKCSVKPEPHCAKSGVESMKGADMIEVMKDGVSMPYSQNGNLQGYQMLQTKDCGILESAGFRQCDVVVTVNGIKVDSPRQMMDIFGMLHGSGGPVEVIRSNVRTKLTIK